MKGTDHQLEIEATTGEVKGRLRLHVAPGTTARNRDAMVDDVLAERLGQVAQRLGVVLAADPHSYAHPLPGVDEHKRVTFRIAGRVEGDLLVPIRAGKHRR